MSSYIAQNEGQEIVKNSMKGICTRTHEYECQHSAKQGTDTVILFKNDKNVELGGDIPLDELIKVSASISYHSDNTSNFNPSLIGIFSTYA